MLLREIGHSDRRAGQLGICNLDVDSKMNMPQQRRKKPTVFWSCLLSFPCTYGVFAFIHTYIHMHAHTYICVHLYTTLVYAYICAQKLREEVVFTWFYLLQTYTIYLIAYNLTLQVSLWASDNQKALASFSINISTKIIEFSIDSHRLRNYVTYVLRITSLPLKYTCNHLM